MSRAATQRRMDGNRPAAVAGLRAEGALWRCVVLEDCDGPRLVYAGTMAAGDAAAVMSALAEHGATRLVRVLPAGAAVCRLVEIPEGNESELGAALTLMAEAELPANMPAHRIATGLVPAPARAGHRAAALVGWTGESREQPISGVEEGWVAEPIALLHMLNSALEPSVRYALAADRRSGAISIACVGLGVASIRALHENGADAGAWARSIERRLNESLALVGGESLVVADRVGDPTTLLLDGATRRDLMIAVAHGGPPDAVSLEEYGVVFAAAAAALGANGGVAGTPGLFSMRADAPQAARSRVGRAVRWIAKPGHAVGVMALAVAFMLIAPILMGALRSAIVRNRSGGLERQREARRLTDTRLAMYRELDARRWPMTKLLADLGRRLPVGVTAESIRIESGQRLVLRGWAESLELIATLQSALSGSGVFEDAQIDRQQMRDTRGGAAAPDRDAGGFEFDISARVARPYAEPEGGEDFAAFPLVRRLYGERATGFDAGVNGSAPEERAGIGNASGGVSDAKRPGDQPSNEAPSAVADAAIAGMDRATAMKEWTRRQSASRNPRFDEATRERLKAEAAKAKTRFVALRDGEGGGGP